MTPPLYLDQTLKTAVINGDLEAIDRVVTPSLWRRPARIRKELNAQDSHGTTLWLLAAAEGQATIMAVLAPHVNRQHRDRNGRDALMVAARGGHLDTVNALLERWGASALARDASNATALMMGTLGRNLAVVERLLPLSDALAQDDHRQTPFLWAVGFERWDVADRLALHLPVDVVEPLAARHGPSRFPRWCVHQETQALRAAMAPPPAGAVPPDPTAVTVEPAGDPSRGRSRSRL